MIERVHLKTLLSFDRITLDFEAGLVVLSGPSGAGKSVLMDAILSGFGITAAEAKLCEMTIEKPAELTSDIYELGHELILRSIKKERTRYYLDDQHISKKALHALFSPYINYLSVRDSSGFESDMLIEMLDRALSTSSAEYKSISGEYRQRYKDYIEKTYELEKIKQREKRLADLIEFATFEINKIKNINPRAGEDEELLLLKKQLSKIDKISNALAKAEEIFMLESSVSDVFSLTEKDGGYFSDTMNQLRADFEDTRSLACELENTDVEALLDRLEKITELKKRHGSIENALEYCAAKEKELSGYQRSEEDKNTLESFLQKESVELTDIARYMTKERIRQADIFCKKAELYLDRLKLPMMNFHFEPIELIHNGMDSVELQMQSRSVATLSGGEHNRLRLALMVVYMESRRSAEGVIVLDEIDANVSGDESIAIADMVSRLSENYQIFAISHQPHLAAKARQHILVERQNGISRATVLDRQGRVTEIARIVGGEMPGDEALAFAEKLLP